MPCDEPHAFEAYAVLEIPGAGDGNDSPGDEAVARHEAHCYPAFKDYVGRAYARSRLELYTYFPTRASWLVGDPTLICVVADPEERELTSSLQNARR